MSVYLPDTNTISALMRPASSLYPRLRGARQTGDQVVLSPVVEYEVRRGLLWKNASSLARRFDLIRQQFEDVEFARETWGRAAELWAYSRQQGMPLPDADILIAAHTIQLQAVLVTNNTRHFVLFQPLGLQLENWIGP